jgi:predicted metal-dependent hydrolase
VLQYTNDLGSGNEHVNIIGGVILNNVELKEKLIPPFLYFISPYMNKFRTVDIKVILSKRKTKKVWGSTRIYLKGFKVNYRIAKINLYRHSVWVFLHELAHSFKPFDEHNKEFADTLHRLLWLWGKYVRTIENI